MSSLSPPWRHAAVLRLLAAFIHTSPTHTPPNTVPVPRTHRLVAHVALSSTGLAMSPLTTARVVTATWETTTTPRHSDATISASGTCIMPLPVAVSVNTSGRPSADIVCVYIWINIAIGLTIVTVMHIAGNSWIILTGCTTMNTTWPKLILCPPHNVIILHRWTIQSRKCGIIVYKLLTIYRTLLPLELKLWFPVDNTCSDASNQLTQPTSQCYCANEANYTFLSKFSNKLHT